MTGEGNARGFFAGIARGMWRSAPVGLVAVPGAAAFGQTSDGTCPPSRTRLSFSEGTVLEAIEDEGKGLCRFRNAKSGKTFEMLLGAFYPSNSIFTENAEKYRSLVPLVVGKRITYMTSGADANGVIGTWTDTVSIEKYETVETAGGTFPAFVILRVNQVLGKTGLWEQRWWFSPQVGHSIKFEYRTVQGTPTQPYPKNWQLVEIQKR